jgi:putative phosphoesterase
MKVVVVSDTHGDIDALRRVLVREYDADMFLHCGDVGAPKERITPFSAVRGNCDGSYPEYPYSAIFDTPYGKIRMEHRPEDSESFFDSLHQSGVRIFLHGHTHEREESEVRGVKIYCPGSVSYPEDSTEGTYLVLTIKEDAVAARFMTIPL